MQELIGHSSKGDNLQLFPDFTFLSSNRTTFLNEWNFTGKSEAIYYRDMGPHTASRMLTLWPFFFKCLELPLDSSIQTWRIELHITLQGHPGKVTSFFMHSVVIIHIVQAIMCKMGTTWIIHTNGPKCISMWWKLWSRENLSCHSLLRNGVHQQEAENHLKKDGRESDYKSTWEDLPEQFSHLCIFLSRKIFSSLSLIQTRSYLTKLIWALTIWHKLPQKNRKTVSPHLVKLKDFPGGIFVWPARSQIFLLTICDVMGLHFGPLQSMLLSFAALSREHSSCLLLVRTWRCLNINIILNFHERCKTVTPSVVKF